MKIGKKKRKKKRVKRNKKNSQENTCVQRHSFRIYAFAQTCRDVSSGQVRLPPRTLILAYISMEFVLENGMASWFATSQMITYKFLGSMP